MRAITIALASLIAMTAAVSAETGTPGTVNAVSDGEISRAKAAITHAGYQPDALEMAQDHNLFFTATKGGDTYEITVIPGAKLYVSTPLTSDRRS
jgi:hypothetical protein